METTICQRWRNRRSAYRPAGEVIDPRRHEVAAMPDDTTAREFIARHHYLRTYPAARRRFGLYSEHQLVGVAVFSHPVNDRTLAIFPGGPTESLELGRLVLLDSVPANGESWFVSRCFDMLRNEGFIGVASFCDPLPRKDSDGIPVFPGHIGTVYQALSAAYLGRSKPGILNMLPDGTVMHRRTIQKIRNMERGWESAANHLVSFGAPQPTDDMAQWLQQAIDRLCTKIRHPGNHKYAWVLNKRLRRHLPASLAYPKAANNNPLLF